MRLSATAAAGLSIVLFSLAQPAHGEDTARTLDTIRPDKEGTGFALEQSSQPFTVWGVNYDHDESGQLIEDYWHEEWDRVVEDFGEIKALGANVVRIHLQLGSFMTSPDTPNPKNLARLAKLIGLAELSGLYLDLTGLACYRKAEVPVWYDALDEAARWETQARFWEAIAKVGTASPAIFCYDLMNEPILPGKKKKEDEWLAGELGGFWFVQRIALDLAGRTREEVAKKWVDKLADAIRKHDERHMITVGVIPWAHSFPKAKPLFYSKSVSAKLDFASVHFYPKTGQVDAALAALAKYDIGKPLVIEETFPLHCSAEDLLRFIDASRDIADGWISFYWGKSADDYAKDRGDLPSAIKAQWLREFAKAAPVSE